MVPMSLFYAKTRLYHVRGATFRGVRYHFNRKFTKKCLFEEKSIKKTCFFCKVVVCYSTYYISVVLFTIFKEKLNSYNDGKGV